MENGFGFDVMSLWPDLTGFLRCKIMSDFTFFAKTDYLLMLLLLMLHDPCVSANNLHDE